MYRPGGETIAELLLRQGEASARAAERSALLWGNAVSNIGNIAGGAVAQYQEQKNIERQSQLMDKAINSWDGRDSRQLYRGFMVAGVSAPEAIKLTQGITAIHNVGLGKEPDQDDLKAVVGTISAARKSFGDEKLKGMWPQQLPILEKFRAKFLPDVALSAEYTPEVGDFFDNLDARFNGAKAPGLERVVTKDATGAETMQWVRPKEGQTFTSAAPPVKAEKTLADIEAEAAARARGTRLGNPPQPPRAPDESTGRVLAQAWAEGRSFPTKGDDVSAALVYMDKHPEEFPNKPRKLSAPQQDKVLSTTATLDRLDATIEAYQKVKSKVGPVTYSLNEWERRIPGTAADPDFITFNTNLRQLGNLEIRDITGAAMAVQEAERLLKGMATGSLKPADFEAAIAVMRQNAKRIRDVTLYGRVLEDTPQAETDDAANWGEWQSVGGGRARKKVKR